MDLIAPDNDIFPEAAMLSNPFPDTNRFVASSIIQIYTFHCNKPIIYSLSSNQLKNQLPRQILKVNQIS